MWQGRRTGANYGIQVQQPLFSLTQQKPLPRRPQAKVTHFGPYDLSSVKNDKINKREESVKTLSKKELNKKMKMLKHHEIDFRRQFMMP